MTTTKIEIISDGAERDLDLFVSFDHDEVNKAERMIVKTCFQGKSIVAVGTHYPFDDAFADLQNKLPVGVQIKCCVACRHGNQ